MWLILLAVVAKAAIFAPPDATALTDPNLMTLPEPTLAPLLRDNRHGLHRRATTSAGEATLCGYYEGSKNSRLACYYGNACVFHASDSEFPGMVGCCPTTSATTPCIIFSTCYASAEISATPQLTSSTTDPFVMLCTASDNPYCLTRTWPDLNVGDVACTDESSQTETLYTAGSLTDVDDDANQITETLSISWIADAALLSLRSVSATTTSTTQSETATPSSGNVGAEPDGDTSTTPVGAIVGGVVGGVLGVTLIVVAALLIWRHQKKASDSVKQPKLKQDFVSHEEMPELHAVDGSDRHELMGQKDCVELPARSVRYELQ